MVLLNHKEEKLNAISHGMGVVFIVFGSFFLFRKNFEPNENIIKLGLIIYSLSFLSVFLFSTLYHSVFSAVLRPKIRILDHISIFLLIGGTQLPLVLKYTPNSTATWFLGIQWILILLGIVKKIFLTGRYRLLSSLIYVGLGCMPLMLGVGFWKALPDQTFNLMIAGGITYLIGVIFYQFRNIPYNHFIWHLFVLSSAIMHWFGIFICFGS